MDAFDVGKDGHLAFRARLRNLQRLGLAPATPGSGKRMQYSLSNVYDLALALNLAEFGLDPKKIVGLVKPGAVAALSDKFDYCIFSPTIFSKKEKPEMRFVSEKLTLELAHQRRRIALISIKEMKFLVDAHLWEGPPHVRP